VLLLDLVSCLFVLVMLQLFFYHFSCDVFCVFYDVYHVFCGVYDVFCDVFYHVSCDVFCGVFFHVSCDVFCDVFFHVFCDVFFHVSCDVFYHVFCDVSLRIFLCALCLLTLNNFPLKTLKCFLHLFKSALKNLLSLANLILKQAYFLVKISYLCSRVNNFKNSLLLSLLNFLN